MDIAGENPLSCQFPGESPRLSSRICGVQTSIDPQLKEIAANRRNRGDPVFEMHTSLVTTVLPHDVFNFARRILTSEHRPTEPGPLLGDPKLRTAIAESRQGLFRETITADNVIVTSGARHALNAAVISATDPGAEIILMPPFFGRYPGIVQLNGAVPQYVPLERSAAFQPNVEAVMRAWNPMTRAILFSSPNNPTGTAVSAANVERLQQIAKKNGGFLILDETFEAFNFSPASRRTPKLDLENTIVVGSYSETFSIPDLKVGYLIASSAVAQKIAEIGNYFSLGTSKVFQGLMLELLKDRKDHLSTVIPMIRARHALMKQALLANPAIESVHGEAGTFVWAIPEKQRAIDCRATVLELAHTYGLLIKPGAEYGAPGCFRIGLGQVESLDSFKRACQLLSDFSGWRNHAQTEESVVPIDLAPPPGWTDALRHPAKSWRRPQGGLPPHPSRSNV